MTNEPEQIREDIERTRRELGDDVDALAEKVRPSSIVHRQTDKVKGAVGRARDRVMGAADSAGSTIGDKASSVGDAVGDLPHRAAETARGNPLAVGLIAFGVGWLAASLLPASSRERQLAQTAKEKAGPAIDQVKQAAQTVVEDMKEPAKDAADAVKGAAQDAAANLKDTAQSEVKGTQSGADGSHVAGSDVGMEPAPETILPPAPTTPTYTPPPASGTSGGYPL